MRLNLHNTEPSGTEPAVERPLIDIGEEIPAREQPVFPGADPFLQAAFEQLTETMSREEASLAEGRIRAGLLRYHADAIIEELGDVYNGSAQMHAQVLHDAMQRARREGFSTVNLTRFFQRVIEDLRKNPPLFERYPGELLHFFTMLDRLRMGL